VDAFSGTAGFDDSDAGIVADVGCLGSAAVWAMVKVEKHAKCKASRQDWNQ
jgi:hypothetical protein